MKTNDSKESLSTSVYGADLMIALLKQHGIRYVACNPGASIRGLQDAIVHDQDEQKITLILCCHEEIAVAMAHGYAKATGKIMAVLLHTNVGLQHASMAVFNAWCDRVPMLLLGGLGPLDASKRRPWIDWIHNSFDQASVIRGFIKWEDQPVGLESTLLALSRAIRLTHTLPKAPVYVGIDSTTQETIVDNDMSLEALNQFIPPIVPQANEKALEQLSQKLVMAKNPVIIVDMMGDNSECVQHLVALADLLSIPVIDKGNRYNFPNNHPLYVQSDNLEILNVADFILAIDVPDLYSALGVFDKVQDKYISCVNKELDIAYISMHDFLTSSAVADYHRLVNVSLPITGASEIVLPCLIKLCEEKLNKDLQAEIISRQARLTSKLAGIKENYFRLTKKELANKAMTIPAVIYLIGIAIADEAWVLANGGHTGILPWIRKLWNLDKLGCYLGFSGGAGLGYGLGASIGAALAYKGTDTVCINLQTDGDFLCTPSALWTAQHEAVPMLIIMLNNRAYNNTKEHALYIGQQRQRKSIDAETGSHLTNPNVDYPLMARSFGMKAFDSIDNVDAIIPTVQQAFDYIKTHKQPVLIDLIIA